MAYAEGTKIAVSKSISDIMAIVRKAGADRIAQAEDRQGIAVQFFLDGRMLRFRVANASIDDIPEKRGARPASTSERQASADQRNRQRARALLLVIKAKLESVESGVETFEEAFLANVVMPDGRTVGEHTIPAVEQAYLDGKTPPLMLPMY